MLLIGDTDTGRQVDKTAVCRDGIFEGVDENMEIRHSAFPYCAECQYDDTAARLSARTPCKEENYLASACLQPVRDGRIYILQTCTLDYAQSRHDCTACKQGEESVGHTLGRCEDKALRNIQCLPRCRKPTVQRT